MKGKVFILISMALFMGMIIIGCAASPSTLPKEPPGEMTGGSKEVIEWRVQTIYSAGDIDYKFFTEDPRGFVQLVKKMSGGRLIIRPYTSGELVSVPDSFDAVGEGMIQATVSASAYWAGKIPVAAFAWGPPFSIYGPHEVNAYLLDYEGGIYPILQEAYEPFNVHLLALGYASESPLFSKKPVNSFADYKGLKVRVTGMGGDVLSAVGASITNLPATDVYMGLETGVIDAANWGGPSSQRSLGFHEITDYILYPGVTGMGTVEIIANKDAWNALPDDLKAIVETAAYSHVMSYGRWLLNDDKQALKEMVEAGQMEVCQIPPEEMAKIRDIAMDYMREYSMTDDFAAEAFNKLESFLKQEGVVE